MLEATSGSNMCQRSGYASKYIIIHPTLYIHTYTCIMCIPIYWSIDLSVYLSISLSLFLFLFLSLSLSLSLSLFLQNLIFCLSKSITVKHCQPSCHPIFEDIGGQRLRYVVLLPRHTTQALLWWNRFRFCWAQKSAGGMSLSGGRCIWHWLRLAMVCWVTKDDKSTWCCWANRSHPGNEIYPGPRE